VTIDHSNWNTHDNNFASHRRDLIPSFDGAVSTLFRDLSDRGILDRTLVVVTGEFGRTPKINQNAGRDHWGPASTEGVIEARMENASTAPMPPVRLRVTVMKGPQPVVAEVELDFQAAP